jgi:DNA repair protein SbcD/Mre11
MHLRFIHTADLHLDTPFKGLGDWNPELAGRLKDATYRSFGNIIDLAITEKVDFVLIAGDIFDSENMSLGAQIRFIKEIKKLSDTGIEVYFICGNHDNLEAWDKSFSLPPGVYRFGSDGVEKKTFSRKGQAVADIYGISFQTSHISESLVPLYSRTDDHAFFSIAMMHGMADVIGRDEKYAPFRARDLADKQFDYWALGHVHKRIILNEEPPVVYPGNPQGRDFGETGPKGCYLVEMNTDEKPKIKFVPVQHLRFEEIKIDLTGHNEVTGLTDSIYEKIDRLVTSDLDTSFIIRLFLTGRTGLHKLLARSGEAMQLKDDLNGGRLEAARFIWVEAVEVYTRPPIDIVSARQGSDFVAGLIREFEKYENDSHSLNDLIERLNKELPVGRILREIDPPTEEENRDMLSKAKWMLLDRLIQYDRDDN